MDVFWPEADQGVARRNLHQAIYNLRQILSRGQPDFRPILFEKDCYLFNPEITLNLDFEAFEQHVQTGRRMEAAGRSPEALAVYKLAEDLYRGDFLEQDPRARQPSRHQDASGRQQQTIKPVIPDTIAPGTLVMTDEYDNYNRLTAWGYGHKTVCHSKGEYARDEDSDGSCEIRVNSIEGFWSLLRSCLRPHRGISQERLPLYLGFFEFIHNVRKRGKALLGSLLSLLLT